MKRSDDVDELVVETEMIRTTFSTYGKGVGVFTRAIWTKKKSDGMGVFEFKMTPAEYAIKGGTKIHCPSCKEIRVCEALPSAECRFYKINHSDISWFSRLRRCHTCLYDFLTAEVPEPLLDELVRLRDDIISGQNISSADLANYGENVVPFQRPSTSTRA